MGGGRWEGPGEEGVRRGAKTNSQGTGVCAWGRPLKRKRRARAHVPTPGRTPAALLQLSEAQDGARRSHTRTGETRLGPVFRTSSDPQTHTLRGDRGRHQHALPPLLWVLAYLPACRPEVVRPVRVRRGCSLTSKSRRRISRDVHFFSSYDDYGPLTHYGDERGAGTSGREFWKVLRRSGT